MEFNVNKCKIMHIGRSNPQHTYCMDRAELTKTVKEKDLGVLMESNSCCTSKILTTYNEDCARASVRLGRMCGRHQSKTLTLQSDFMKQNEIKLIKF